MCFIYFFYGRCKLDCLRGRRNNPLCECGELIITRIVDRLSVSELSVGWVDPWVGLDWVGLGWVGSRIFRFSWVGLGWVCQLVGWVALGPRKWKKNVFENTIFSENVIKWNTILLLSYCTRFTYKKILLFNIWSFDLWLIDWKWCWKVVYLTVLVCLDCQLRCT